MKVLVSGSSGFVGKHLIDRLKATNHQILALSRQNMNFDGVEMFHCDLNDLESLKHKIIEFKPDATIHLAWQGIPDYSDQISRLNLKLSIDFLGFIIENTDCRKIIVSGSCWEYGKDNGQCREDEPINIKTFFTWAKCALFRYLSVKCQENKVSLIWFRIFYIYGPGQREGSLMPMIINSIKHGKAPLIINPYNKNDFIYVGDVSRALQISLNPEINSGIYNLGSGESISVHKVCFLLEKQLLGLSNISKSVLESGTQTESVNFWANIDLIKKKTGWQPKTKIEDGIFQMINEIDTI